MKRRVVITGAGLVSPLGMGVEANWDALVSGRSGIRTISRFDATGFYCQIAGEIRGFNPEEFIPRKEVKKMDLFIQYALAATAFQALTGVYPFEKGDVVRRVPPRLGRWIPFRKGGKSAV